MAQVVDCIYTPLENGIHEFVFNAPNRAAVDKHFDMLEDIYQPLPKGEVVRVLIVLPNGFPPMNYVFGKARSFTQRHADNPGYYAFLYQRNNVMLSMLQSFFRMMVSTNLGGFFPGEERDQAIDWLLKK